MRWDIFVKPFKVKLKVWHFDPIDSFISNALWCCVGEKWLRKKTAVPILMALAVYCLLMPDGGKAALRAEQKWGRNSNDTRLRPVKLRDRAINRLSFFPLYLLSSRHESSSILLNFPLNSRKIGSSWGVVSSERSPITRQTGIQSTVHKPDGFTFSLTAD